MQKLRTVSIALAIAVVLLQMAIPVAMAETNESELGVKWWYLRGAANSYKAGSSVGVDDPPDVDSKTCADLDQYSEVNGVGVPVDGGFADSEVTWLEYKLEFPTGVDPEPGDWNKLWKEGDLEVLIEECCGDPTDFSGSNSFRWTANFDVDAVIVKDGEQGATLTVYNGWSSNTDADLPIPPAEPVNGWPFENGNWLVTLWPQPGEDFPTDHYLGTPGGNGISHISFCYQADAGTAIELASFTASATEEGVTLAWETGAEIDNAGYNVYRAQSADGQYAKVNGQLIAAAGNGSGASYDFVDDTGDGLFFYKLEDVDTAGVSTLHGPVQVQVGAAEITQSIFLPMIMIQGN